MSGLCRPSSPARVPSRVPHGFVGAFSALFAENAPTNAEASHGRRGAVPPLSPHPADAPPQTIAARYASAFYLTDAAIAGHFALPGPRVRCILSIYIAV